MPGLPSFLLNDLGLVAAPLGGGPVSKMIAQGPQGS